MEVQKKALEVEVEKMKVKIGKLNEEKDKLIENADFLTRQTERLQRENNLLKDRIKTKEDEVRALKATSGEAIERLKNQAKAHTDEILRQKELILKVKEEIKRKEERIKELQKENEGNADELVEGKTTEQLLAVLGILHETIETKTRLANAITAKIDKKVKVKTSLERTAESNKVDENQPGPEADKGVKQEKRRKNDEPGNKETKRSRSGGILVHKNFVDEKMKQLRRESEDRLRSGEGGMQHGSNPYP